MFFQLLQLYSWNYILDLPHGQRDLKSKFSASTLQNNENVGETLTPVHLTADSDDCLVDE